jgi:hypothetical protein
MTCAKEEQNLKSP